MQQHKLYLYLMLIFTFTSCSKTENTQENSESVLAKPPVKITHVRYEEIATTSNYKAYSSYLNKEIIRSPINGYLQTINATPGMLVKQGQLVGRLETQEAKALAQVQLASDSTINFGGNNNVYAPSDGIIDQVNFQKDAFVQQGDQLMDMVPKDAIVFIVNVPFENLNEVQEGMKMAITLPNGSTVKGVVSHSLPISNSNSQVKRYIIHPDSTFYIPNNINAQAMLKTKHKSHAQVLNKKAVLSNETLTKYWVMKLINDSTAVKTPITKGIETADKIEILAPEFSENERLLYAGHYGLPDTAKVQVIQ